MKQRHQGVWVLALVLAALAGVFTLYGHSDFMVQIANQMWTCL